MSQWKPVTGTEPYCGEINLIRRFNCEAWLGWKTPDGTWQMKTATGSGILPGWKPDEYHPVPQ